MLVTASDELKFHHWPDEGPEEPYSVGITASILSLSWSKDNFFLLFLQENGRPEIINIKDLSNIKPVHVITAIDKATVAIFQKNTKKCVAIGTAAATVALYDTKTKSIGKLFTVAAPVISLDFNVEDEYLAVGCNDGVVYLFNIFEESEAGIFNIEACPTTVKFHQTERNILGATTLDGQVAVIDIHETSPMYLAKTHVGKVNGLVFSLKDTLVSVGEDNKFCVHDLKQKTCVFTGHLQHPLTCVDITPDGKHLAIGTQIGSVCVYETRNYLTPLLHFHPHSKRMTGIRFSHKFSSEDQSKHSLTTDCSNHSKISSLAKVKEENEFKSLYNKFINKCDDDDETLKVLRDDIVADIQKDADELHMQMRMHMSNLQEFIKKEFEKMAVQMDDKWDLLNMVSGNYKVSPDPSESPFDTENPLVLE